MADVHIGQAIIFNTWEVNAILTGDKTQLRLPVSPKTTMLDGYPNTEWVKEAWKATRFDEAWVDPGPSPMGNPGPYLKAPEDSIGDDLTHRLHGKYRPGDEFWAKEAWAISDLFRKLTDLDQQEEWWFYNGKPDPKHKSHVVYEADTPGRFRTERSSPWRPARTMPKWASRISLRITSRKLERIQDVSKPDLLAEGHIPQPEDCDLCQKGICSHHQPLLGQFINTWDYKHEYHPWESNPWVWVFEFKALRREDA